MATGTMSGSGSGDSVAPGYSRHSSRCWRKAARRHIWSSSSTARQRVPTSRLPGKRGQQHQAFGRSRGGFSTKIHLKTDLDGNPLDFHLTGGEASDSTQFETSLDIGPNIRPRIAMTDKGYDSEANRARHSRAASIRLSRAAKTPSSEDASFRNASTNFVRASNRQSASSSASSASPCVARRPTSATQPSSVSRAGSCW